MGPGPLKEGPGPLTEGPGPLIEGPGPLIAGSSHQLNWLIWSFNPLWSYIYGVYVLIPIIRT